MIPAVVLRALARLGGWERAFLLALAFFLVARLVAPGWTVVPALLLVVLFFGVAVTVRLVRAGIRGAVWRLRNRLLITYLLIAVVPIALIVLLAGAATWLVIGQIAVYVVQSQLEERIERLSGPALGLAATAPSQLEERLRWMAPYLEYGFSSVEVVVRHPRGLVRHPPDSTLEPPPAGWTDTAGVLARNDSQYLWAHRVGPEGNDVTILARLDAELLANLAPGIGEVSLIAPEEFLPAGGSARLQSVTRSTGAARASLIPAPANWFDLLVYNGTLVPVSIWESPGMRSQELLAIQTRPSAVLKTVYREETNMGRSVMTALWVLAVVFLVVEMVALFIGVSFTRTITSAVHNLYEGTQRIQAGDFSHRIPIGGRDQLGELGESFNRMTENMERLLRVEKEEQRLRTDLEIAQRVQSDLFPRELPRIEGLEIAAQCNPANMVSGDYYDFVKFGAARLGLAFGDVAGKGISAALLMASVQSTMRVHISNYLGKNGEAADSFSPADLVARINRELYAHTSAEKYSTFFFGLYDAPGQALTYSNAGHLPPILWRRGRISRLEVTGMVVGAFPFAEYKQSTLPLEEGDLLVCFTDGITEPENEFGEMFGEERLLDLVRRGASLPADDLLRSVIGAVRDWTGSPVLQDDVTVLIARKL